MVDGTNPNDPVALQRDIVRIDELIATFEAQAAGSRVGPRGAGDQGHLPQPRPTPGELREALQTSLAAGTRPWEEWLLRNRLLQPHAATVAQLRYQKGNGFSKDLEAHGRPPVLSFLL